MIEHRFSVGQIVRMKLHHRTSSATTDLFQITGRLPAKDDSPQYRMRNCTEPHEHVATEDLLEAIVQMLPAAHRQSS